MAFAEVVVGPGPLSPIERGYLVEHTGYRAPGFRLLPVALPTTVGLLNRPAEGAFRASTSVSRTLVTRHRSTSRRVRRTRTPGRFRIAALLAAWSPTSSAATTAPAGWAIFDTMASRNVVTSCNTRSGR